MTNADGREVLLKVRGLSKQFGGVHAVSGVDLDLYGGEILGLIGPNGAGKSTFFNVLSGIMKPTGGTVELRGRHVRGKSAATICRMGLVRTFQHQSIFSSLSVSENLRVAAMGSGLNGSVAATIDQALKFIELETFAGVSSGELPHGYERLLGIGMAFASGCTIVCLDEPLAGLNAAEANGVLEKVRFLRDEKGCSILFIEHNVRAVMGLCDRIIVLDEGRKIADGSPQQVQSDAGVIAAYLGG
jgi:branched-chain amino acid transport system ATP-binding protein